MPLLGVVILVIIVLLALLAAALAAGLVWAVVWLVKNRHLSRVSPKSYYARVAAVLVLLAVAVFLGVREVLPPPPAPAGMSSIRMGSSRLAPYRSMYAVPRAKYGFTPLPKNADVDIELPSSANAKVDGYDALLHIYPGAGKTKVVERTISFKRVGGKYQWIGEQEMWTGPHQYTLPDGSTTNENISITYETQPGEGAGLVNTLQIMYDGDDARLSGKDNLTLKDVQPILKKWGAYQQGAYEE
jgi:hypothetical protein